jgi:hypothetical protein
MVAVSACKQPVPNEKVLFFHIPKTAGTALRNLFTRHLGEHNVSKNRELMPLEEALVRGADFTAVCGHFRARQGSELPGDRVSVTVLRDPLDRFLSDFFYLKFGDHQRPVDQRVRSLDIEGFIEQLSERDADELNIQTSLLHPLGTAQLTALSWPEKVAAAQRALDHFDLVGVHGEIDDLVCMVCARMRWQEIAPLDRVNVTSRRIAVGELSSHSRNKLESLLAPDRAVFEHALVRFRQLRRDAIRTGSYGTASQALRSMVPAVPSAQSAVASAAPAAREFGDRRLEITGVTVTGELSGPHEVLIGETLSIYIDFVAHEPVEDVTVGISIRDERGLLVFGTNTYLLGETYQIAPGTYSCKLAFVYRGERGAFTVDANLIRNGSHLEGCHHWKERVAYFDVPYAAATYFEGRVLMDTSVELTQVSPAGGVKVSRARVGSTSAIRSPGRLNPALTDFSARITPLSAFPDLPAGTELLVDIELENTGSETWRATGRRPVHLSYHWQTADGDVVEYDGLRTSLLRDIGAGEHTRLVGLLRVPLRTGSLRLTWALVQEDVGWSDEINRESRYCVDVLVVA